MSDDAIRRMLGTQDRARDTLPEEKPPRIDMSRCRTYAVDKAEVAMGLFKAKYGVNPTLCVAAPIGGRSKVEGWTVGLIPSDWSESDSPTA